MQIIGIIAEYNPFHNGHLYHLKKIKEMYPDSLIILILNGYFLMRGEVSLLSKETKTKIALDNDIDIVIEHPFFFSSNSADIFALSAVYLLDQLSCDYLIFGSESNNIELLNNYATAQLENMKFTSELKKHLKTGISYPKALNNSLGISDINQPNDLLGISYIKAIKSIKSKMIPLTIQRTNDYHDTIKDDEIISASNIRKKIKDKKDIKKYLPFNVIEELNDINEELLFKLIKYQILTNKDLSTILSVDEGLDKRLIKHLNQVDNLNDLVTKVKSKRYTYNRIRRMLIHVLLNYQKDLKQEYIYPPYIKILGFNNRGQVYLNKIKKKISIPLSTKIVANNINSLEIKCATIYQMISNEDVLTFELANKPIKKP